MLQTAHDFAGGYHWRVGQNLAAGSADADTTASTLAMWTGQLAARPADIGRVMGRLEELTSPVSRMCSCRNHGSLTFRLRQRLLRGDARPGRRAHPDLRWFPVVLYIAAARAAARSAWNSASCRMAPIPPIGPRRAERAK